MAGNIKFGLSSGDELALPEPISFPVRIVIDSDMQTKKSSDETAPKKKRSDYSYEAWDKFLCRLPNRRSTTAKKIEQEKKLVDETPGDGLQMEENAFTSWKQAADECKAKVAAIVEECKRLNQKYRDVMFDLDTNPYCLRSLTGRYPKQPCRAADVADTPPGSKRIEDIFGDDARFFIDGATANDVHQGNSGDCWFLAALMAVTAKKDLVENVLCIARDEKVGVYGFVFFRDGEWIHEVIDDNLYLKVGDDDDLTLVRNWDEDGGEAVKQDEEKLKNQVQKGGEALYFAHCKSNETWLPLIEKAYAKAHGDYFAIEGGYASEGIEDLTGGVAVVLHPQDIMDKDRFWKDQLSQVNKKYLFGGGSKPNAKKGIAGSHAYAVLETWEEGDLKLLKLRNPWGEREWTGDWSDGSKLWTGEMMMKTGHTFGDDGIFWMSYPDFLKHFPAINRVRLFSEDWQVSQCWTCVNVPWTVDYLESKFQFTISEKCPVVIVLSQPDDRYFTALRGRYFFSLHFRVYKEGEENNKWIVRSMHNSGNETIFTRSVSAEIEDLEPGTYDVVFKVTAYRSNSTPTAEEAILEYAVKRKEKLLAVGRRFDYAQSKGNLRAMEQSNRRLQKQEERDTKKSAFKKVRSLNKQERERARKRKKRVRDAMREKRKALEEKQRSESLPKEEGVDCPKPTSAAASKDVGEERSDSTPTKSHSTPTDSDKTPSKERPELKPAESITSKEEPNGKSEAVEAMSTSLSKLKLRKTMSTSPGAISSLEGEDDDSSEESMEELNDMDFDFDSDMDGPLDSNSDDESPDFRANGKNEIFAEDPWNAMCVLGLRVYSSKAVAKINVIKGENNS